jgi:serine/threonine protein phosphatase PrpC/cold shock CspA family protein
VPPTDLADYQLDEETGWHVYKRTAKWHYQVELGVFLHVKSNTYYKKLEETGSFRKIVDEEKDSAMKKLREWEKMRKAVKDAEFVSFTDPIESAEAANASDKPAEEKKPEPVPEKKKEPEDQKFYGKVQKFDGEKGFGFIVPTSSDGKEDKTRIFVHRKHIMGSSSQNPLTLKEGSRVTYKTGEQDGRPCALDVCMLGSDGKPLSMHTDGRSMEEKRKSLYVSAETLKLRVHVESWPGLKKTLCDRYTSAEQLGELGVFYGIFKGHGSGGGGAQVADACNKVLHKNVMNQYRILKVQPQSRDEKLRLAMRDAYMQTDKDILESSERKKIEQIGSSAITAVVHGNPKIQTTPLRLVVANVGSSRAVLCRSGEAVALSDDHKPTRADEKKRVERAGGLVLQVKGKWHVCVSANPHSMNKAQRREYQGLEVTRSLGDLYFKNPSQLSVCEPETVVVPLSEKDLFLVLATDGIWNVLSNQEVIDLAASHFDDAEEAAKKIVRTAHQKGSEDNLTAMVLQFGWSDKNAEEILAKRRKKAGASTGGGGGHDDSDLYGRSVCRTIRQKQRMRWTCSGECWRSQPRCLEGWRSR